jgi:Fic family protein
MMLYSAVCTVIRSITIMLFEVPNLGNRELEVMEAIDDLAQKLRLRLHEPRRWSGSLRRMQFARAVQGSNSIEGFDAAVDDAAAIELGEEPLDASEETRLAIKGYCDAMTYVLQMSTEPDFHYGEQLLKSLHFMMTGYDLKNRPGLWRLGSIFVRNEASGEIVYEGADIDDVPALTRELVRSLNAKSDCPPLVLAGMAHLNLVMIHPFRDGNGRIYFRRFSAALRNTWGAILSFTTTSWLKLDGARGNPMATRPRGSGSY